jgi:hypothetical protein
VPGLVSVPPSRGEQLEAERRWMRPAGIAAILGVIALFAAGSVKEGALDGDTTAERLLSAAGGDIDGQLLLSACLAAVAFLAFAGTLTYLFMAARRRSDRVLRQLIGLAMVGGVFLAASQLVDHFNFIDAADDFAAAEAQREAPAPESQGAESQGEPEGAETTTSEEEREEAEDAADDRAQDARDDAPGATAARVLALAGTLALAIGFFYTSLWSMRTGLLSRLWGSFGMASAVVFVLIPGLALFTLVWFLATGLMLLGVWVGGRPPAWEAGVAIPWQKPGEQAQEAARDAVEGQGRELTERPLPEGETEAEPGAPQGEPPGEPPRKRKRRR